MRSAIIGSLLFITALVGNAQVNLQTGSPEQNFPLINYTDGKAGLSLDISLNYSGGNGLLVNEVASNVGTGWNVAVGGFITRMQNGEPDDQMAYNASDFWADKDHTAAVKMVLKNYPNGYLFNPYTNSGCNVGLNYYPVFKHKSVYKELNLVASDMEQDKFFFNVNGRTGVFVIGKNLQATIIGDTRIKINFSMTDMTSQGIRTRINQFIITTEDGIKYTFNQLGLTHLCRYKCSEPDGKGNWNPISGDPNDDQYAVNRFWGYKLDSDERPYVVSSWFLSEMENPNTGQKIIFNYQNVSTDFISATSIDHSRILNKGKIDRPRHYTNTGRDAFHWLENPVNAINTSWDENLLNRFTAGPTSVFYTRSVSQSKRLSSITLPNGGQILFTYNSLQRADMPGENALNRITYVLAGKIIRGYEFKQGYFFKDNIRPYESSFSGYETKFPRLCLLSVQKIGNTEDDATEPPYLFNYYTGSTQNSDDIVPAPNFLAQDHWGYYNGSSSGLPINENHDFLSNERTQYFKTVLPKYKNAKSGYAKNGLLKSVNYPTGGNIEYTYEQNKPSSNILPTQYEQLAGGVSVSKVVAFDGEDHTKDIITEYVYKNLQNQSSRWGDESPENYSLSWTEYNKKWVGKIIWNKAGLAYPEAATNPEALKFILKLVQGYAISKGISMVVASLPPPYNVIGEVIVMVVQLIKLISSMGESIEFHRYTLSNKNNMLANSLPGYYSIVQVKTNSPTGYNGKTVYEFTNLNDYPALIPKLQWPFIQNQRLANWAYGLPKKVTVYDKNDLPVTESQNYYNYIVSKKADANNQNCKCATVNKREIKGNEWENYYQAYFTWNQVHWMIPRPYFIYTGRTDLQSSSEKTYVNGQLSFSNVSNTIVDPMTLLQKGKIIHKDATTLIIQLTYYPTDYNIPNSAMARMVQLNAIHTPIATETWMLKGGAMYMLDATVTQYNVYQFGSRVEVKPLYIWKLKTRTPIPQNQIGMHNPAVLIRQPQLFRLESSMSYDNDGNLVQTDVNENQTSFINDYNNRLVVASAANASSANISYTSFEADGLGGWNFNPSFIKTTDALTGAKSFKLGLDPSTNQTSTITRTGLDPNKTYIITYWQHNVEPDVVYVNGQYGQSIYSQQYLSGWVLFQHEITGVTQITITGDALIDELRLYPKGALMSTVAYKEGIGKITECDANNRLVYYEYDALGRLKLMRDQNKNIIKTYEYNFKQ